MPTLSPANHNAEADGICHPQTHGCSGTKEKKRKRGVTAKGLIVAQIQPSQLLSQVGSGALLTYDLPSTGLVGTTQLPRYVETGVAELAASQSVGYLAPIVLH